MAIAVTLAGGCSQDEELRSELRELRESSKATIEKVRLEVKSEIRDSRETLEATTEKARLEQQRAVCRGTAATALIALHWELWAARAGEKKMIGELTDAFRSKPVEWTFISASRQTDDPPLDEFEAELVERFAKSPSAKSEKDSHPPFAERRSPVDGRYEYYQPSFFKNDCFACHFVASRPPLSISGGELTDPEPYAEGDLIAIIKIRLKE